MKRRTLLVALAAAPSFARAADVKIEAAWARPTVAGQLGGGAFLTLTSDGGDRLLGARTPAARRVELHEMRMEGDVMRMRQVDAVALPAGEPVRLEPGGLHLMVMGLKAPLKAGEKLPLVLSFEKAGERRVDAVISATRP